MNRIIVPARTAWSVAAACQRATGKHNSMNAL